MKNKPTILTVDLETSPMVAYSWGPKWDTNLIEVKEQSQIMSYSAKWLKGKQTTKGQHDYKGYKKGIVNDKEIIRDLWNLLEESDIIIVQNGKSFDVKVMNARFLFNEMTPPSPYKIIDTKTEAKKYLRLPSNSLDDICDYFGIGRKLEHEGFPLWKKCMAGDKKAWKRMLNYNAYDVRLTEKLYIKLLPYIQNHPPHGLYMDNGEVCPNCGSAHLQSRGYARNKTTKYRRLQCIDCGSWSRTTTNVQEIKPLVGT